MGPVTIGRIWRYFLPIGKQNFLNLSRDVNLCKRSSLVLGTVDSGVMLRCKITFVPTNSLLK